MAEFETQTPGPPLRVFVSYRRRSLAFAKAVRDQLSRQGNIDLFMDITVRAGTEFPELIASEIARSDVVILLIDRSWTKARRHPSARREIDDPDDWVLREVLLARDRGVPIVPVRMGRAPLLTEEAIGAGNPLLFLTDLQCGRVRPWAWRRDLARLVDDLSEIRPLETFGASPVPPVAVAWRAYLAIVVCALLIGWIGYQTFRTTWPEFVGWEIMVQPRVTVLEGEVVRVVAVLSLTPQVQMAGVSENRKVEVLESGPVSGVQRTIAIGASFDDESQPTEQGGAGATRMARLLVAVDAALRGGPLAEFLLAKIEGHEQQAYSLSVTEGEEIVSIPIPNPVGWLRDRDRLPDPARLHLTLAFREVESDDRDNPAEFEGKDLEPPTTMRLAVPGSSWGALVLVEEGDAYRWCDWDQASGLRGLAAPNQDAFWFKISALQFADAGDLTGRTLNYSCRNWSDCYRRNLVTVAFSNRLEGFDGVGGAELLAAYPSLFPSHDQKERLRKWLRRYEGLKESDRIPGAISVELSACARAVAWLDSEESGRTDGEAAVFGGLVFEATGDVCLAGTGKLPGAGAVDGSGALVMREVAVAPGKAILASRFETSRAQWLRLTGQHGLVADAGGKVPEFKGNERLDRFRPIDTWALSHPKLAELGLRVPRKNEWMEIYGAQEIPNLMGMGRLLETMKEVLDEEARKRAEPDDRKGAAATYQQLLDGFRLLCAKETSESREELLTAIRRQRSTAKGEPALEQLVASLASLSVRTVSNLIHHRMPLRTETPPQELAFVDLIGHLRELVDQRGVWPPYRDPEKAHPKSRYAAIGGGRWDKLDETLFRPYSIRASEFGRSLTLRLVRDR